MAYMIQEGTPSMSLQVARQIIDEEIAAMAKAMSNIEASSWNVTHEQHKKLVAMAETFLASLKV